MNEPSAGRPQRPGPVIPWYRRYWVAVAVAVVVVAVLFGAPRLLARTSSVEPAPRATPTTSSASSSPTADGTAAGGAYDAASVQAAESSQDATSAERAQCAVPDRSLVDRVLSAVPAAGAGARVERSVAFTRGPVTFVAVVTDVGFGTWAVQPGVGIMALDGDAAGLSGYPLTTTVQHEAIDPANAGRGRVLACVRQGFPGDPRRAG